MLPSEGRRQTYERDVLADEEPRRAQQPAAASQGARGLDMAGERQKPAQRGAGANRSEWPSHGRYPVRVSAYHQGGTVVAVGFTLAVCIAIACLDGYFTVRFLQGAVGLIALGGAAAHMTISVIQQFLWRAGRVVYPIVVVFGAFNVLTSAAGFALMFGVSLTSGDRGGMALMPAVSVTMLAMIVGMGIEPMIVWLVRWLWSAKRGR